MPSAVFRLGLFRAVLLLLIHTGFALALLAAPRAHSRTAQPAAAPPLATALAPAAPGLDRRVLGAAVRAMRCAQAGGQPASQRLAVIDYSRPSSQPRLWVFDLATRELLFKEHVAHGKGSGGLEATVFSNEPDSHTSSLGLFRTLGTYTGRNGYSLRMEGLEPGFNDAALARAIVMHGADYVSDRFIRTVGRLGRSFGCPAVRPQIAQPLIDALKDGQYVFAWYPDADWLAASPFLGCGAPVESPRLPQTAAP